MSKAILALGLVLTLAACTTAPSNQTRDPNNRVAAPGGTLLGKASTPGQCRYVGTGGRRYTAAC